MTGFAAPGIVPFVISFMYSRTPPVFLGIEVLDGRSLIGQFLGTDGVVALGLLFSATSTLGLLAGRWLWKSRRRGGLLGIVILSFGVSFGVGFGVPLWLIVSPLQAILLVVGWKSLDKAAPRDV